MTGLKISASLELPRDAATQTFAILGLRGSGKTNTAVDMLEEMLKVGQQVVWIDPVDVAWGIRSSRDGHASGFAVTILGGEHGDVPLEGDSGKLIADFVIDNNASVILSLRHLSMNEQRQFATDFAERIYERKGKAEHRDALHIFVDECDEFVPQNIEQGKQRLFGAFDRLVRRGRSSGIGLTLISQRPQVVNKSVLSQCETLICHRILHKLDRKAVDEWVQAHDTEGRREVFMQSLASLARGEAWVWSPSWLDVFVKVQMRQRETFDSSATPVAGKQAVVPKQAAEVDLEALREKLKRTIDKVKENDPAILKRRIAELERAPKPDAEREKMLIEQIQKMETELKELRVRDAQAAFVKEMAADLFHALTAATRTAGELAARLDLPLPETAPERAPLSAKELWGGGTRPKPAQHSAASSNGLNAPQMDLTAPQIRILEGLGRCLSIKRDRVTRPWVAFLAGASPKSSAFTNNLGALRTKGFIDYENGLVYLTENGRRSVHISKPMTEGELHDRIIDMLPVPQGRILNVLLDRSGKSLDRPKLAELAGASPTSSAFTNNLGAMRSLGLIEYGPGSTVFAKQDLFL